MTKNKIAVIMYTDLQDYKQQIIINIYSDDQVKDIKKTMTESRWLVRIGIELMSDIACELLYRLILSGRYKRSFCVKENERVQCRVVPR